MGFVDLILCNAHVLHTLLFPEEKLTLLEFRRRVVRGLVSVPQSKRKMEALFRRLLQLTRKYEGVAVPLVPDDVRPSGLGDHWPKFVSQCSRCKVLSLKQVQSRTHSICSKCGLTLCINERKNCSAEYHEYHQ